MKYKSEDDVKKALGVESWRHLPKEKITRFVAMMPEMDTEVRLKIIEQFPEFSRFALQAVDVMEKRHESTLSHNKQSQDNVHRAYQEIREILKTELNNKDLTWEQRRDIIALIVETGTREFEKDSENKRLLDGLFTKIAAVTVAAIAMGAVFVGAKIALERKEAEDQDELDQAADET